MPQALPRKLVNVCGAPSPPVSVSGGTSHTCVQTFDGRVQCWGNSFGGKLGTGDGMSGNLGDANPVNLTSVAMVGMDTAVQVAVGQSHS